MKKAWIFILPLLLCLTSCGSRSSEVVSELVHKMEDIIITKMETESEPLPKQPSGNDSSIVLEGACGENTRWAVTKDLVLVISGQGDMGHWTARNVLRDESIPNLEEETWLYPCTKVVVEEGVTALSDHCFMNMNLLEDVTLPKTLTYIGEGAFEQCSNLKHLVLPESVSNTGPFPFLGSGLEYVALLADMHTLPDKLFCGCEHLGTISIPEGVSVIGAYAFQNCSSLVSIAMPSSLQAVRVSAFQGCSSLKNIYYPTTYEDWTRISIEADNGYLIACQLITPDEPAAIQTDADLIGFWANADQTVQMEISWGENSIEFNIDQYLTESTWNNWFVSGYGLYEGEMIYVGYYAELMLREDGSVFYNLSGYNTSGYFQLDDNGNLHWFSYDSHPSEEIILTKIS